MSRSLASLMTSSRDGYSLSSSGFRCALGTLFLMLAFLSSLPEGFAPFTVGGAFSESSSSLSTSIWAGFEDDVFRFLVTCPATPLPLAGLFRSDDAVFATFCPSTVRVEFVRVGCFWMPAGFAVLASVGFSKPPFFPSTFSDSFFPTLLTSPSAVRFRFPSVPLDGTVAERFVTRAFLGTSPAVVSSAAAFARVRR